MMLFDALDFGPRERYAIEGPDSFSDAELLALVMGTGAGGRPALRIAEDLLQRFGGLAGLEAVPAESLTAVRGVGLARAVRIHAALNLGRRPGARVPPVILGPVDTWRYMRGELQHLQHEELHALYLNRRCRLMHRRQLTRGNDRHTIVDPKQVLRPAVAVGAAAVVLVHNHPAGDPEPSMEDVTCTLRVHEGAEVLGIELHDHIVLSSAGYRSMSEMGLIRGWRTPFDAEPG